MANNRPPYAVKALRDFLNYLDESNRLLDTSEMGITVLTRLPPLARELTKWMPGHDENNNTAVERAERIADFAEKEIESGFSLLHAHTIVGLWGALEAAVGDTLLNILINEPDLLKDDRFAKVRIPLAEFETMDKDDRMRLLLEEISRTQGAGHKQGVDKFEVLLENLKLSGPVDEPIKKTLWELNHVRNGIVHRGAVADRRLLNACPWLELKTGEKIVVTHTALRQYHDAVCQYATALLRRLAKRFDDAPSQHSSQGAPCCSSEVVGAVEKEPTRN